MDLEERGWEGVDWIQLDVGPLRGSSGGGRGRSDPTNSWQNSSLAEQVPNLSTVTQFHVYCQVIS